MSLSRRRFIQTSSIALCAGVMPLTTQASVLPTRLPIPPLLESRRGQPLFLTLLSTQWTFINGRKTSALGMNGLYLGPTVRVQRYDDIKLIYTNRLAEPVSMTISGLQVPGALMGGAARMMSPNTDWAPVIPIRQPAATCWYHANTPGHMASQVYHGLAGLWLIEDEYSKNLTLPRHYGLDDFPLIIQDKRFNNFGSLEYDPPEHGGILGNRVLVNGVEDPYVEVSRGWIRLRLLNASNARRYLLQMSDGRAFNVVANDQGFLPKPVAVTQLSLAPGERRDVLIDMSKGEQVTITAGMEAGLIDRLRGLFQPSDALLSAKVLTLKPTGLFSLVTDNLPSYLSAKNGEENRVSRSREFHLGDKTAGINGAIWSRDRIDVQTTQGSYERWIISATVPQAFHIQGVCFLIKRVNGVAPMAEDRGWKDTVWVDGSVELLVYFNQPSSEAFPFMYYSQTLEMADRGSMGQLVVRANT